MTTFKNSKYYTDREITVERKDFYGTGDTLIGVHDAGVHLGETVGSHMYLEDSTAHALADWIIANVPKPEPKTAWDHWLDLPIGATYRIREGSEYRKISDTHSVALPADPTEEPYEAEEMHRVWENYDYNLIEEFTVPLPTKFAAVVKSEGIAYTMVDSAGPWNWVSSRGGRWVEAVDLQQRGFEVIFAGVDD